MLRKVLEFGSVLEHVCQLLTPKVVDLEVVLGWVGGLFWGRLEGRLEVVLGASCRSSGRILGE